MNGQRTESNYYSVDGVSANIGVSQFGSPATSATGGSLPAATALGTTQGLVSVDAMEEFRVQSSSYSAEYGRNPGGQFSFVTRSGTNDWHGSAFDYLRNNVLDANNWFNNYYGQPQPAERQNDFGGTVGGPVRIPHLYNGKDKTFFFFSYEGLHLDQPQPSNVTYVPDADLRSNTPAPLQQVLNAFPVPNGADLGNGLAQFIGTWSNPGNIDSTSIRGDHVFGDKLRLFFRFSDTSSGVVSRGTGETGVASVLTSTTFAIRTYTLGATSSFSSGIANEFRLNCSSNQGDFSATPSNFGGAEAVNLLQIQGFANTTRPSPDLEVGLFLGGGGFPIINESRFTGEQRQWNVVDSVSLARGRHQLKFGVDFRRLEPGLYATSPVGLYRFFSESSVLADSVDEGFGQSFAPAFPVYTNFSAYAQDSWKVRPRLTVSMGLRWEVNPPPGAGEGESALHRRRKQREHFRTGAGG